MQSTVSLLSRKQVKSVFFQLKVFFLLSKAVQKDREHGSPFPSRFYCRLLMATSSQHFFSERLLWAANYTIIDLYAPFSKVSLADTQHNHREGDGQHENEGSSKFIFKAIYNWIPRKTIFAKLHIVLQKRISKSMTAYSNQNLPS